MVERRELKPGEESKTHLNKAKNTKRSIGHDQLLACMPITNAERERERERERSREREVERERERSRESSTLSKRFGFMHFAGGPQFTS